MGSYRSFVHIELRRNFLKRIEMALLDLQADTNSYDAVRQRVTRKAGPPLVHKQVQVWHTWPGVLCYAFFLVKLATDNLKKEFWRLWRSVS